MKLSLIFSACLVVVAPSVLESDFNGKSWMLFPGENGRIGLVLFDSEFPDSTSIADPKKEIRFFLYTRSNPDNPTQIYVGDSNLGEFKKGKKSKFIIHGYLSSFNETWVNDMKNSFLDDENCNVIAVDWSGLASSKIYNRARANVQPVGEYVGDMYKFLKSGSKTHCVGHSLGSHVCGFSGKRIDVLDRITGMDPALPLFSLDKPAERLANSDANYVDVIHTCGGRLGFKNSIGHADFYPNGGVLSQPECSSEYILGVCSHASSHEYFTESINNSTKFRARKCSSWELFQNGSCDKNDIGIMGNPSKPKTRGDFYLITNDSPCLHTSLKIAIFITFVNLISKII